MTNAVIQDDIYWLKLFPLDKGVFDTLSPSKIVIVLTNPNYEKLTIDFRSYAQVHTRANKTTKSITIGENVSISSEEHNGY